MIKVASDQHPKATRMHGAMSDMRKAEGGDSKIGAGSTAELEQLKTKIDRDFRLGTPAAAAVVRTPTPATAAVIAPGVADVAAAVAAAAAKRATTTTSPTGPKTARASQSTLHTEAIPKTSTRILGSGADSTRSPTTSPQQAQGVGPRPSGSVRRARKQ
jgi:hypothetical protein